MRHKRAFRKLGRTTSHRKALRRNMAQSLFEHGQITTTLEKAKELRPFAERLITLAKKARAGELGARRRIHHLMGERFFIPAEHQEEYNDMSDTERRAARQSRSGRRHRTGDPKGSLAFTTRAVSHRLIQDIAERYADRPGGYTRLVRLSSTRLGDQGAQAVLQLVGEEETPGSVPKPGKSARRRRADVRYGAVMKASKKSGARAAQREPEQAEPTDGGSAGETQRETE